MIGPESSLSTTSPLVGKYRKNVLSEISTSSMICCTVVASNPCVKNRCSARLRIVSRVRSFLRSRRPAATRLADADKWSLLDAVHWQSLLLLVAPRQEQQREHQPDDRDAGRDEQR